MKNLITISLLLIGIFIAHAQVTRSAIQGRITDAKGNPITAAQVTLVHEPSGTVYTQETNENGFYIITNMRVGGPYTATVESPGFGTYQQTGLQFALGVTQTLNVKLREENIDLETIQVAVKKNNIFNGKRTGAENTVNRDQLESLPNVSGSVADFVRLSPQVNIEDGPDGSFIRIAGQNNRYNSFYIDGGVNNDVFGLSGSGLDGGQTGGNPFAFEELDQITVSIAPYDVRQSGFAGGAINAVTRSGSNNTFGSLYYFFRRNQFAGQLANYNEAERKDLPDFKINKFGASVGGSIIKDKLFFFTTFEREDNEFPNPFTFAEYRNQNVISQNDLANLRTAVLNTFGYDIGNYDQSISTLIANKFVTRLDWNVSKNHQLSLRYKYTGFDNLEARFSTPTVINFDNGSEFFVSKSHSLALEWNAKLSSKISNQLLINAKRVQDDRDFIGDPFPAVTLQIPGGSINFGSEPFSTANALNQTVISAINNMDIKLGKHLITVGGQFDYYDMYNLFIRQNFGAYTFGNQVITATGAIYANGFQRFMELMNFSGTLPNVGTTLRNQNNVNIGGVNYNFVDAYNRSYSLLENAIGDDATNSAAEFKSYISSFYAQDEFSIAPNFKLTGGIRLDLPYFEDSRENPDFNSVTLPRIYAAGYNLNGARVGRSINANLHISPRLGFNWNMFPEAEFKSQLRGGSGIFTSRMPLVWLGGLYNNTGTSIGAVNLPQLQNTGNFPGGLPFVADPNNQYILPGLQYTGQIDLFDPNMRLPQRWRTNLGFDQELPGGFVWTTDILYDKVINDVYYQNVNLAPSYGTLGGPLAGGDNRQLWNVNAVIDNNYGQIIFGSNTSEGYSYNFATTLTKKFRNGLASVSYSYGDSWGIFEGTSSQNNSQWAGIITVNGANNPGGAQRNAFSQGHRYTSLVSYSFKYLNDRLKTTISLFYEGQEGAPYSFVYSNASRLLNDGSNRALIYIPKDRNDINLQNGYLGYSADYQWEVLNAFIESDSYLRRNRGKYAERNSHRMPWSHVVDLRILQDFNLRLGQKEHTFQFSFDIVNLTNLLNKNWGRRYINSSFNGYGIIDVVNITNNNDGTYTPLFGVNPDLLNRQSIQQLDNIGTISSIWQLQFGIRYFFK